MSGTQDLLRRFRRIAAPPGRAAPATIPADRTDAIGAELADVFATMDEVDEAADRIEREAAADARRIRDDGATEAERILAEAEMQAQVVRAEAAASHRRRREEEIAAISADAEREAREFSEGSNARIQAEAARILDALIGSGTPTPPG